MNKEKEIAKISFNNSNQKGIEINTADMCASIRKTVTDILIDKL